VNENKIILDVCCGGRMFWFDKQNPYVLFCDNRRFEGKANDGRNFKVDPEVLCDFTALPFPDKLFKHVVFDPPQMLYAGRGGQMALHYTILPKVWHPIIKDGFNECWRVLDDYGTLIFKWSEHDIPVKKVIEVIGRKPLYGHKSGRASKTHWMCFVKIPSYNDECGTNDGGIYV
jgi:SAM-dependent methyltransferase